MKIGLLAIVLSGFMANAYAHNYGLLGTNFGAPAVDGKDNVYAPNTGDIVYDASDATFYGRTHSSTWIPFGGASATMPVGAVITFAGAVCPTGYLLANGLAISRTDYEDLFNVIGTSHGEGDGTTTFHLPDYRGRFLRGVDGTAGNDPDAASRTAMNSGGNVGDNVGSVQADAFQGHFHGTKRGVGSAGGGLYGAGHASFQQDETNAIVNHPITDGVNGTPRTSSETRPKNAYVNFCVKH